MTLHTDSLLFCVHSLRIAKQRQEKCYERKDVTQILSYEQTAPRKPTILMRKKSVTDCHARTQKLNGTVEMTDSRHHAYSRNYKDGTHIPFVCVERISVHVDMGGGGGGVSITQNTRISTEQP
jgi:hypothetical protein